MNVRIIEPVAERIENLVIMRVVMAVSVHDEVLGVINGLKRGESRIVRGVFELEREGFLQSSARHSLATHDFRRRLGGRAA